VTRHPSVKEISASCLLLVKQPASFELKGPSEHLFWSCILKHVETKENQYSETTQDH